MLDRVANCSAEIWRNCSWTAKRGMDLSSLSRKRAGALSGKVVSLLFLSRSLFWMELALYFMGSSKFDWAVGELIRCKKVKMKSDICNNLWQGIIKTISLLHYIKQASKKYRIKNMFRQAKKKYLLFSFIYNCSIFFIYFKTGYLFLYFRVPAGTGFNWKERSSG